MKLMKKQISLPSLARVEEPINCRSGRYLTEFESVFGPISSAEICQCGRCNTIGLGLIQCGRAIISLNDYFTRKKV